VNLVDDAKGRAQYSINALIGPSALGFIAFDGIAKSNLAKTKINYAKVNYVRKGLIDTCNASGAMVGRLVR